MRLQSWAGATLCSVLSLRVRGQHSRALNREDSTSQVLDIGMEPLGGSKKGFRHYSGSRWEEGSRMGQGKKLSKDVGSAEV